MILTPKHSDKVLAFDFFGINRQIREYIVTSISIGFLISTWGRNNYFGPSSHVGLGFGMYCRKIQPSYSVGSYE